MRTKVVQLCFAVFLFTNPFVARADALIDDKIARAAIHLFTTKICALGCQRKISGEAVEIKRVDINADKKAEYLVSLTSDCGSAGCRAALFMYRERTWVKLIEGLGLRLLDSDTNGFLELGAGSDRLSWDGQNYVIAITPPLRGGMVVVNEGHFLDPLYNNGVAKKEDWRQHLGTDYFAAGGTPVYATRSGDVEENKNPEDPMQARVIVQHPDRSRAVYGHVFSKLEEGTRVMQGEVVGHVRDSNAKYNFSSHLHYGENVQGNVGENRNPTDWGWGRAPYNTAATTILQGGWIDVQKLRGWGGDAASSSQSARNGGSPSASEAGRKLKLGQSVAGVSYRQVGTEGVVFLGNRPVTKCAESLTSVDAATSNAILQESSVHVTQSSSRGQFAAIFCVDEDWGGRSIHILDLKNQTFYQPKPWDMVALLAMWISFSPDEQHAVLNQSGDEGNYTTLVLDLKTGQASVLDAPLFPVREPNGVNWTSERTLRYESTLCDGDDTCRSNGVYALEVDIVSKAVKTKRLRDAPKEQ